MIRKTASGAPPPEATKGILFDKDGTLVDFHATWGPAYRRGAQLFVGGDPALTDRLLVAGGWNTKTGRVAEGSILAAGTNAEIAETWLAALPEGRRPDIGDADPEAFIEAAFNAETAKSAHPVTDLVALFSRLQERGLVLGLATNDSHDGALASLRPFGIVERLAFVAGYDSGHGGKPGPGMVEGFCKATGLSPGAVMVVGDNLHDMEMGRSGAAGVVVGVLSGSGSLETLSAAADWVIDGIVELEHLLDQTQRWRTSQSVAR
jgi:phosphoglycolate phosphatase